MTPCVVEQGEQNQACPLEHAVAFQVEDRRGTGRIRSGNTSRAGRLVQARFADMPGRSLSRDARDDLARRRGGPLRFGNKRFDTEGRVAPGAARLGCR